MRLRHAPRQDAARGRRARLLVLLGAEQPQGLRGRQEAQEDRQPLERHRGALPRRGARAQALPARPREHGLHVPDAELPERAADRLDERDFRRFRGARAHARVRQRAHGDGQPILKRDSWQHRFVDHATNLEAARALAYKACELYNDEHHVAGGQLSMETVKLISMLKIFVGETVGKLMDDCLQLHGGMGYMDEGWVGRAWRDQRLFRIGGGTSEVLRYYVAKLMGM
ncbi:MAG: acyl-CoA dehydrogenase family protein [Polyangiales bacterium]